MGPGIPWSEVLELPVVKAAARVVERRWGLALGFVDGGGAVRPPRPRVVRSECPIVQSREVGEAACQAHARESLAHLVAAGGERAQRTRCHAGLGEIAAPIDLGGEVLGALICGGADRSVSDAELSAIETLLEEVAGAIAAELDGRLPPRRVTDLADQYVTRYSYDSIIGRSPPMQELYQLLDRISRSDSTVLIQGENGTGKELVARAIHYNSARKHRRFVVQNCSAFNDNLLDSELFGHVRGAFTGAISDKRGLFEVADQGTFFLDEIGDMSPVLQVKVLRVLQEGTLQPVGGTEPRQVDVRIIAATNRDLRAMVERGEFREDLYYRIHVINLVIPPLRDRAGDLEVLADHFLSKHARGKKARRLSEECRARLRNYSWPGNVRELENEIERLLVLAGDERVIAADLLSARIRDGDSGPGPADDGAVETAAGNLPDALRTLERKMIVAALSRHGGNKTRAADELGISRRNLIRLAQKYRL
jgi:transcriptional regulator with PAS, ATPase and Fis domain